MITTSKSGVIMIFQSYYALFHIYRHFIINFNSLHRHLKYTISNLIENFN